MDKKHWTDSLELLENLLKKKFEELEKMKQDIEEIEYSVECYKKKISALPDDIVEIKDIPTGVG